MGRPKHILKSLDKGSIRLINENFRKVSDELTIANFAGNTIIIDSSDNTSNTSGNLDLVIGDATNKLWLNNTNDGVLALGGTDKSTAPFRVDSNGDLTATSATISGSVTATSGAIGGWDIAAGSLSSGTTHAILDATNKKLSLNSATFGNAGIQLDYNSGTPRAYIGDGANAYLNYDGTKLTWKAANTSLDASGNLTASSATLSGNITATSGSIGGWDIGATTITGNSGTIRTASSGNRVEMSTSGLFGYDTVLGTTFSLPTDGSAPTFSSGIINETVYEISTNAVLRTSETALDGTANSAGVLINNSGIYAGGANQNTTNANIRIGADGNAVFQGTIYGGSGGFGSSYNAVTVGNDGLTVAAPGGIAVSKSADITMKSDGFFGGSLRWLEDTTNTYGMEITSAASTDEVGAEIVPINADGLSQAATLFLGIAGTDKEQSTSGKTWHQINLEASENINIKSGNSIKCNINTESSAYPNYFDVVDFYDGVGTSILKVRGQTSLPLSPQVEIDSSAPLLVDTISEKTTDAGVTVDGVLLKDSEVTTDVIKEKTSAAGVTVDGLKIKDGVANLPYAANSDSTERSTTATSYTEETNLTTTVVGAKAGDIVKISFSGNFWCTTTNRAVLSYIRDITNGNVAIGYNSVWNAPASFGNTVTVVGLYTIPADGNTSFRMYWRTYNGAGTSYCQYRTILIETINRA